MPPQHTPAITAYKARRPHLHLASHSGAPTAAGTPRPSAYAQPAGAEPCPGDRACTGAPPLPHRATTAGAGCHHKKKRKKQTCTIPLEVGFAAGGGAKLGLQESPVEERLEGLLGRLQL